MTYADIEYANTYFGSRLHTKPWDNAPIVDRNAALAMATRDIDRLDYRDAKAVSSQELEFPRGADTEVPDDIKIACCEIALALLDGVDVDAELDATRVLSDGFSGVRTTYDSRSVPEHVFAMIASPRAWRFLRPFVREPGNIRLDRVS